MASNAAFGSSQSSTQVPPNGFYDRVRAQWFCNCVPRQAAIQLQVTRDTANKNRWFLKCPVDRSRGRPGHPSQCDFFLWAEDALERQDAVDSKSPRRRFKQTTLSASVLPRPEGPRGGRLGITPIAVLERQVYGEDGPPANGGDDASSPGSATMRESAGTPANSGPDEDLMESDVEADTVDAIAPLPPTAEPKRKRVGFDISDESDDGSLTVDEVKELIGLADSVSRSEGPKTRDAFTTPMGRRTTDLVNGMPTPSLTGALTDKPVRRNLFGNPSAETPSATKRQRVDGSPTLTPSKSPTAASPGTAGIISPTADITGEVMALLKGQNVDATVLREVRGLLGRHAAVAKGLELGRDASRQAVKKAEARNAQLQQRVADLENKRKLDAEARKKIMGGLKLLSDDD